MLMPFDSRDINHKSPFGSVRTGDNIHFAVTLPRDLGVTGVRLRIERVAPEVMQGGEGVPGTSQGGAEVSGTSQGGTEVPGTSQGGAGSHGGSQCGADMPGTSQGGAGSPGASLSGEGVSDLFWRETDGITEWWECDFSPAWEGMYLYYFEYSTPWGLSRLYRSPESTRGMFSDSGERWQQTVSAASFVTPGRIKGGIIYQIFPDRFRFSGEEKQSVPSDRILRADWGGTPEWRPAADGKIKNNDYFCGDLKGIEEKLDYLSELSVSCIYLNPIFEAHSNHRYDTADYMKIDPLLGTAEDFTRLCKKAEKLGITVILDGVFSHTGADSVYFNKNGRYDSPGAYNSESSPYRSWYTFGVGKNGYASWWDFPTLPEVRETDSSYSEFITGDGGVIVTWLAAGAGGFRLDVADELPDEFIKKIRTAVKRRGGENYLLGEVWEDASNKISFGKRREYLFGQELDSVMNYPFMNAVVDFMLDALAEKFMDRIMTVVENYPPEALNTAMNPLGTHDTARILTVLSGADFKSRGRDWQSGVRLSPAKREAAAVLLRAAAALQYTLPGVPSIYYGDEAGCEGCSDPFNRGCYPWGAEDEGLVAYFRKLGQLRRGKTVLKEGRFVPVSAMLGCVAFRREDENGCLVTIANMNPHAIDYTLNGASNEPGSITALLGCYADGTTVHIQAKTTAIVEIR